MAMVLADPLSHYQQGFGNALATGQQMQQMQQRNALANLYQTQGQGIAQGDAQALNALAALDPMAAMEIRRAQAADQRADRGLQMDERRLGFEEQRLGMERDRFGMAEESHDMGMKLNKQQLEEARRAGQRAAETHAAQMDEITRQREAEEINAALSSASAAYAQGPQAFEAWKQQNAEMIAAAEMDPAAVTYEAFPGIAAGLIGAKEGLLAGLEVGQGLTATEDRYKAVGGNVYDWRPEDGGPPRMIGGSEEIIYGPDGQPIVSRGPSGTGAKLTETQAKDNVYSTRMEGALSTLNSQLEDGTFMADTLTSRANRAAELDPTGLARELQDEDFQVAKQAGDEFLLALLRKDTGAAVTESEQTTYGDVFLPRPGDKAPVLEAKRAARIRALEAVKSGMNPQQIAMQERALINAARETGRVEQASREPQQSGPLTAEQIMSMDRQSLINIDVNSLDDAALDAYVEALR